MLRFNCQFPVDHKNSSVEDLWALAEVWLCHENSKYGFKDTDFANHKNSPKRKINDGTSELTYIHAKPNGYEISGIELVKPDPNLVWKTRVVGCKDSEKFWMTIRIDCESRIAGVKVPWAKKPQIIQRTLEYLGNGLDGGFIVNDQPNMLKEDDLDLAADIVQGKHNSVLPIVYISTTNQDKPYINPITLSQWLSGLANVVVEPSRDFSYSLRSKCEFRNPYAGGVAIIWPDNAIQQRLYPGGKFSNSYDLQVAVSRAISSGLLTQKQIRYCSWEHLVQVDQQANLERVQNDTQSSSEDIQIALEERIEGLEEEMKSKNATIEALQNQLNSQSRGRKNFVASGLDLYEGKEASFYENEIERFILEAIVYHENNLTDKQRRRKDVLSDLINANSHLSDQNDDIRNNLREILRSYKKMDRRCREALVKAGFTISEEGKHYKCIWHDDPRYSVILPKTGSDYRGGMNSASDIQNLIF